MPESKTTRGKTSLVDADPDISSDDSDDLPAVRSINGRHLINGRHELQVEGRAGRVTHEEGCQASISPANTYNCGLLFLQGKFVVA